MEHMAENFESTEDKVPEENVADLATFLIISLCNIDCSASWERMVLYPQSC